MAYKRKSGGSGGKHCRRRELPDEKREEEGRIGWKSEDVSYLTG